jgi:amino acid transporter
VATPKVFAREATGLVRAVSVWDAFLFNNWTAGGAWSSLTWLSVYPIWFPNADIIGSLFLTMIISTLTGLVYALAVTVMPRSASDYVFVSRSMTPAIGIGFALNNIFWWLMINSWNVYVPFAFISQTMFSIGAMVGSPALINGWSGVSGNSAFLIILGIGIFLFANLAILFGVRRYMKVFQRFTNILSLIAFVIILYYFVAFGRDTYIANFTHYFSPLSGTPDPYHDIINLATSLGYVPNTLGGGIHLPFAPGYDWNQTVAVAVLWWFISLAVMGSAWIAGEVKSAGSVKAQVIAMLGANVFTLLLAGGFEFLWFRVFDYNWLAALGYIVSNYPSKVPAWISPAAPYWGEQWVNIMIGNVPLALIVSIAWFLQGVAVITPLILMASRQIFAWSFDRVIPTKFSEVSERFASPTLSIIVIGIIMMIGFIFTVYTSWLNFAVAAPMGVLWSLLIVSIASVVFWKRRKGFYESSPVGRLKFLGMPAQPLIGVLSSIGIVVALYYYFGPINPLALGGISLPVTEISLALFILGAASYYVAKFLQSKRGIDISLAFQEIPPE